MPNTITSYNTFIAGTKAKASDVNTNFSNYRGTIIPISPSSVAGTDRTHDLGSSEYYWSNAYLETTTIGLTSAAVAIHTSDTTGSHVFDTSLPTGYVFKVDGTEVGLPREALESGITFGATIVGSTSLGATSGNTDIADLGELTVTVYGTEYVEVGLGLPPTSSAGAISVTGLAGGLLGIDIIFVRAATITVGRCQFLDSSTTGIRTIQNPPSFFGFASDQPGAGTHTYKIQYTASASGGGTMSIANTRIYAKKI